MSYNWQLMSCNWQLMSYNCQLQEVLLTFTKTRRKCLYIIVLSLHFFDKKGVLERGSEISNRKNGLKKTNPQP